MTTFHAPKIAIPVLTACLTAAALSGAATAKDLVIGSKIEPGTLDPHFRNSGETKSHLPAMTEYMLWEGNDLSVEPHLISELKKIDDKTYEVTLRDGVKFHDGSTLDAADFAYTIKRIPAIPGGLGDFNRFVGAINSVETTGDLTLTLHLSEPVAELGRDLTNIMVLPSELGMDVAPTAFDTGEAVIGTGPYKYKSFVPGQGLTMTRFDDYWGGTPPFDSVTVRPIPSDPSRVASLLSGEVDLIDNVALADAVVLRKNEDVVVYEAPEARLMFVMMDSIRDDSPFIKAKDGSDLDKNPLKDARVREALSLAVDRDLLVDRVLEGAGIPASQMLPETTECVSPNLQVLKADPDRARELLAEAGYPDGFSITLHGPADRYPGGERIVQALAQFWSRVGLEVNVETMTSSVFFDRASANDYSIYFAGYGGSTVFELLNSTAHTNDPEVDRGAGNRGRYSNAEVDELIVRASGAETEQERCDLVQEASDIVFGTDHGIIPLYHPYLFWAARADAGISYEPNPFGYTWVRDIELAK